MKSSLLIVIFKASRSTMIFPSKFHCLFPLAPLSLSWGEIEGFSPWLLFSSGSGHLNLWELLKSCFFLQLHFNSHP